MMKEEVVAHKLLTSSSSRASFVQFSAKIRSAAKRKKTEVSEVRVMYVCVRAMTARHFFYDNLLVSAQRSPSSTQKSHVTQDCQCNIYWKQQT